MQKNKSSALNSSDHIISLNSLSNDEIDKILERAQTFKSKGWSRHLDRPQKRAIVALFFFEPSTRTAMSFSIAVQNLGHSLVTLPESSSLSKGETLEDTLLNVEAMGIDLMVIRSGDSLQMDQLPVKCKILNAGWGSYEHPTQALVDLMTLKECAPQAQKVLFIGDLTHSRVFRSLEPLLKRYGYEVRAIDPLQAHNINELQEQDFAWADVVYLLRVQKERHQSQVEMSQYHEKWGLTHERLKRNSHLKVMHPGPMNYGVEIFQTIHQFSDSLILKQVENGVFLRAALIDWQLGEMTE